METSTQKKERRTHSFNVALTQSERELFKNEATKRGTSISSLLRQAAIKTIQNERDIFQNY